VSRLLHIKVSSVIVFALALVAAACGNNTTATAPSTVAALVAGIDTFTGQMAPGGTALHQFNASATGTVKVTLTATDPPAMLVGLGIGIPGSNIGTCDLTKTVQARPGTTPQLTATVETGLYCAGAFDVGGLSSRGVLVTISVDHP
jgi:hypothetical protein